MSIRTRQHERRGENRRPGFTMIELMVVVVVMAVIAGMALPRVNLTQYRMDAAARLSRVSLQKAQRLAITRQHDVVISFDLTRQGVRTLEDANNNGMADAGERTTWNFLEEGARFATPPTGLTGAPSSPVVGTKVQLVDGMPSIILRRNGATSTDLELYMTGARPNTDDFRAVAVVQSTGRADWFRFIGSQWKPAGL